MLLPQYPSSSEIGVVPCRDGSCRLSCPSHVETRLLVSTWQVETLSNTQGRDPPLEEREGRRGGEAIRPCRNRRGLAEVTGSRVSRRSPSPARRVGGQ